MRFAPRVNSSYVQLQSESRRRLLGLGVGSATLSFLEGCCSTSLPVRSEIVEPQEPLAAPLLKPEVIFKSRSLPTYCVDVHTHFFNASDVPVKGYLEGPVAHSMPKLKRLIQLLAPIADALADLAPSASLEYRELKSMESSISLMSESARKDALNKKIEAHRIRQSNDFFTLLKTRAGLAFREEYDRLQTENKRNQRDAMSGGRDDLLNENSLLNAMEANEKPLPKGVLRVQDIPEEGTYVEGILGFLGYMLSYRWANLRSYQNAFSVDFNSIGVDRVITALVDFDRWLDCPPRSSHEDQMRLFHLISKHSNGYVLPLIGYNPWTDAVDEAKSEGLKLVETAIQQYGFVGAKIYPPNGFLPYGIQDAQPGGPDPLAIERVLKRFWDTCVRLDIPVMAHAGESMGRDDAHNELAGPRGWAQLVQAHNEVPPEQTPRVNLGHFGGDDSKNDWTQKFAQRVMSLQGGHQIFGDLGYWVELACGLVGKQRCTVAEGRLVVALDINIANGHKIADRVMFGSDWLMLSKERHWASYASELVDTIDRIAPAAKDKIFGGNAKLLFKTL